MLVSIGGLGLLELKDLFVQSPGDFFYHVMAVLFVVASLGIALGQRNRHPHSRTAQRYGIAMTGTLLGWGILLAGALYSIFSGQSSVIILPPLERAVSLVMLLLIGWAFLTADDNKFSNIPLFVLLTMTVLAYILTGMQWSSVANPLGFNVSNLGIAWSFIDVLAALVGAILMIVYFRNVIDAPLKLVFFLILLFGFSFALWQVATGKIIGNYNGITRLTHFLALPILPLVVYRKVIYGYQLAFQTDTNAIAPVTVESVQSTTSASKQSLSPVQMPVQGSPVERESVQLLRTLGMILKESDPSEIPLRIVEASVEVLKADVGALLDVKDANYADILVAYDRAMRRPIPAMLSLNLQQQLTLVNAIERKQQRPLFVDRNIEELEDLYSRLDVTQVGPVYFQPLMRDDNLIAILIVALPYAKRELRDAERELLKGIGIIAGSLLSLSYAADDAMVRAEERAIQAMVTGVPIGDIDDEQVASAHREMQSALDGARDQNKLLQQQVAKLKIELDDERTRLTNLLGDTEQGLSITQRILSLNDEHEHLRIERDNMMRRLHDAETALAGATGTDQESIFNATIETFKREKEDLSAELGSLHTQLNSLREASEITLSENAQDLLTEMSQEKDRLQQERDRMFASLLDIEGQLQALGFKEGTEGLMTLIQHLYDQRSSFQVRADALQIERDALLNERKRFERRIRLEEEREVQIEAMEAEIRHLATDREAITRQRDQARAERKQAEDKVDKIKEQRARLLADMSAYQLELEEARIQIETFEIELQKTLRERSNLASERDRLMAERHALKSERDQLMARVEGDQEQLRELSANAHEELTAMISDITIHRNQLEMELSETKSVLSDTLRKQSLSMQSEVFPAVNGGQANPELMMSMVEELRTPMTSVVDYIDLLVGESTGFLSEMQRKFVQRISANVVRLDTMLNDLTHITALDTGQYQLNTKLIDLVEMIEDSITNATYQFREKDLTVALDLDDDIPAIYLDEKGILQILGQLLTNAYLASPAGTDVVISAKRSQMILQKMTEEDVVIVAVRDSGGGISADDQTEVFARRYRSDDRLIDGLGDTGVGLPISKALAEAHGGQMWFDITEGVGTTFYFSLPLTLELKV